MTDSTLRQELIEIVKLAKGVNISGNTKPGEWQGFTYLTDLKQDVEKLEALIALKVQEALEGLKEQAEDAFNFNPYTQVVRESYIDSALQKTKGK